MWVRLTRSGFTDPQLFFALVFSGILGGIVNYYMSRTFSMLSDWRRTVRLIKDIEREPFEGLGKTEPLRHDLTGFWSGRIPINTA